MKYRCAHCGKTAEKPTGHVNRARDAGLRLFCDRRCAGLGRRKGKTKAQRIEEKRLYDLAYRAKNLPVIKAKKHAYFKRTYDPAEARVERKKRAKAHVEYCRRPEYRKWKREYDRQRRDGEFGDFAEVARLTIDLNRAIKERMSNHEISVQNGTINKTQRRRRATSEETQRSRPRHRERRPNHSSTHG